MKKLFGANWRSSLSGYLTGASGVIYDLIDAIQTGQFSGKHGAVLLGSIGIFLLSHNTKDKQVTGGSVQNDVKQ